MNLGYRSANLLMQVNNLAAMPRGYSMALECHLRCVDNVVAKYWLWHEMSEKHALLEEILGFDIECQKNKLSCCFQCDFAIIHVTQGEVNVVCRICKWFEQILLLMLFSYVYLSISKKKRVTWLASITASCKVASVLFTSVSKVEYTKSDAKCFKCRSYLADLIKNIKRG